MNDINQDREVITLDVVNKFLSEIRSGDSNHGLSIAQMMLSEGPNFKPEMLILLVEAVVELSVLAGSADAKEYLAETWPILKRNHLRRLTNKIGGSD